MRQLDIDKCMMEQSDRDVVDRVTDRHKPWHVEISAA